MTDLLPDLDADDSQLFWIARFGDSAADSVESENHFRSAAGEALQLSIPCRSSPSVARHAGLVVLLDGEIHDTRPLTEVLGWGSDDRGKSGAELILVAYRSRGRDVLPLLFGEYAVVIWDQSSGDCLLARDPVGLRPLCYGESGRSFFASPSPDLIVAAGVSRELDRTSIAEWVLSGTLQPAETFYAHVRRLAPGHILERTRGRLSTTSFLRKPVTAARWGVGEAHEEFERLLQQSLRRALSGRRACVFLSGGLDSATLAAVAAEESKGAGLPPPLALSMHFPYPGADESAVQRAIASELGLPIRMKTLHEASGPEGTLSAGLRQSARSWLPLGNPWFAAYTTLVLEGLQEGCGVFLTGEGGNNLLEPSWDEISGLAVRFNVGGLRRFAQARKDYYVGSNMNSGDLRRLALRHSINLRLRRLRNSPALRSRSWVATLARRRVLARIPSWAVPDQTTKRELVERRATPPPADGSLMIPNFDSSPATYLEGYHQLARRLDIPVKSPYFDRDLLELRAQLPFNALMLGGRYKGLAQESYRRRVGGHSPDLLRSAYFHGAFGTLLGAEKHAALRKLGGLSRLASLGIVRPELDAELTGVSPVAEIGYYQTWQVLACEAWLTSR